MKVIGSGTISKCGNSVAMEFLKRYLMILMRVFIFAVMSTALVAPVFMVFMKGFTPWVLTLSVCSLLVVCASCK